MKKRILGLFVSILLFSLCFSFMACQGTSGKSAYEIACDNGFIGTEQEWLDSLVGKDGSDGANGTNGSNIDIYDLYAAYVENVDESATFEDFLNSYLNVDFNDTTDATLKAIPSTVSVYCTFTQGSRPSISTAGSGVIYRLTQNDVYIITNYHVIYYNNTYGIASSIEVFTYGLEYSDYSVTAEFIGGSINKDIAVLKANISDFYSEIKAVSIADSNKLTLGERTIVLGNPSAEGIAVTAGVVSVDSEDIEMSALNSSGTITMRVIRTDTAINSGNSGGGLFNTKGQLIGIVNAKSIETDIENIGFAIPVNVAVGIANCVIENNSKKCLLGVSVLTHSLSVHYDLISSSISVKETMIVEEVTTGSLASGKIQVGDKLVHVRLSSGEEMELTRSFHLPDFLYKVRSGDTIYLTVEREGEQMIIELIPTAENSTDV